MIKVTADDRKLQQKLFCYLVEYYQLMNFTGKVAVHITKLMLLSTCM